MFEKPICRQAEWTDILSFFLLNIVVHAATVPPSPGSAFFETAEHIIWSLFTPYYGAVRAVRIISHASIWASTPLQRALRAEALCVVARTKDWKTNEGTIRSLAELRSIYGAYSYPCLDLWWDGDNLYNQPHQCQRSIHGKTYIPPESGYAISQLPDRSVKVEEHLPDQSTNFELPCNHSILKPLLAILQIIFGLITLYRSRGDQLTKYGYGAPSLTVIPYVLMSVVNLIAASCSPEYPSLFLVESEIMDEARARGCTFSGTVGRIKLRQPKGIRLVLDESKDAAKIAVAHRQEEDNGGQGNNAFETIGLIETDNPDLEAAAMQERLWWAGDDLGAQQKNDDYEISSQFIGKLCARKRSDAEKWSFIVAMSLLLSIMLAPFIIIGFLTGFEGQKSSTSQKVWFLVWLVFGMIIPPYQSLAFNKGLLQYSERSLWSYTIVALVFCSLVFAPAIGMFVTVGKSIMEFGVCKNI